MSKAAHTPKDPRQKLDIHLAAFDNSGFSRGRSSLTEALWLLADMLLVSSMIPGSAHRRWILRLFGAKIGKGVRIKPRFHVKFPWRLAIGDYCWLGEGVWIDNLDTVAIKDNCCISQEAYLCTGSHDWSRSTFDLVTKPIVIGKGAWIAAKAVVGPGVVVGEGAMLALASVATRDLVEWTVYQGVPASPIGKRILRSP
jgi:putative colanic acid biosynthesis acetyltransferase WcaF